MKPPEKGTPEYEAIKHKQFQVEGVVFSHPSGCKDAADRIVRDFDDLCKSLGIKWFIDGGACLGFHRDGEYIAWDRDIDVGVICSDEEWIKVIEGLQQLGFERWHKRFSPIQSRHWLRDQLCFHLCRVGEHAPDCQFYANLETINYEGRDYPVPAPIEGYLEWVHGKDWRTPKAPLGAF